MRSLGVWKVLTFYGVMGAIGLLAMTEAWHHSLTLDSSHAHGASPPPLALVMGLVSGLVLVVASRLAALHVRSVRRLARGFRALVMGMTQREVLVLAVMSGLGEEVLFRGALQPALGLWMTAAIFGVLHVVPDRRFLPWTIMAFLGGLVFGGLALWSGGLLAPVAAHVTVNFLNLRFLTSKGSLLPPRLSLGGERAVHP